MCYILDFLIVCSKIKKEIKKIQDPYVQTEVIFSYNVNYVNLPLGLTVNMKSLI